MSEAERALQPEPVARAAVAVAPADDAARTAGRGGLAIATAKVSFILFGFAQQLLLPRLLGVDGYGEVSRVLAIVGIVNNVVVAASIQGVSRAVSTVPADRAGEAFGRTLRIHALLAITISTAFALVAGLIANAVGAPHVTAPLRLVGAVVLLYGVYAPLVGSLNGRRRFVDQAGLDILYGMLRTIGIAGGAFVLAKSGHGVIGAIGGFVAAAALIVPLALTRAGLGAAPRAGTEPAVSTYLAYLGPLALGQVFLNLLMQTDFMLLSRFTGRAATTLGLGAAALSSAAGPPFVSLPLAASAPSLSAGLSDELVGVYRGVQLFAFLPYQMLMSITFVLFPMLAKAQSEGDQAAVRRYTVTGVRLSLLITGLMCGTVAALAPSVLRFAFPLEMSENGGTALRILAIGMGSFSILGIASAALTSLHRERVAAVLTATTVGLVAAGCFALVPRTPFGPTMLVQTAIATSTALTVAAITACILLQRTAGGVASPLTLARVLLAIATTIAIGSRLPWIGRDGLLGEVVLVAGVYVAVLFVTREIGKADLATIKSALGRRR